MFRDFLFKILDSRGVTEDDIYRALSSHTITDEEIFTISRLLNGYHEMNIPYARSIGSVEIRVKLFEIEVDYIFYNSEKLPVATITVNFMDESLFVIYKDIKVEIGLDLLDFKENRNKKTVLYARMQVLNELLTRYYSKVLYDIYVERRRYW